MVWPKKRLTLLKRILVVKWDQTVGPQPVVQYPPEDEFIDNENLVKIWSIHELQENPIVHLGIEDVTYLSYKEETKMGLYFVIFMTDEPLEEEYRELHAGIATSLLKMLDTPNFLAGLQEMYQNLTAYTNLNEDQLIATIYQDRVKSAIFDEIRQGILNKTQLQNILKKKQGVSVMNFDLLLSSFIRLGIVLPESIVGEDYLFLKKDYFPARLPVEYLRSEEVLGDDGPVYLQKVQEFFTAQQESPGSSWVSFFFGCFKDPAYTFLHELANRPLPIENVMQLLGGDENLFSELEENQVVTSINNRVFLLAGILFIPFRPTYILGELKKRYFEQQVTRWDHPPSIRYPWERIPVLNPEFGYLLL